MGDAAVSGRFTYDASDVTYLRKPNGAALVAPCAAPMDVRRSATRGASRVNPASPGALRSTRGTLTRFVTSLPEPR